MATGFLAGNTLTWKRGSKGAVCSRKRLVVAPQSCVAKESSPNANERWPSPSSFEPRVNPLRRIPIVSMPEEHLGKALKVADRASLDVLTKRGKSFNELARLTNLKKVETLRAELTKRLKQYLSEFPRKKDLHPYESALVDLTLQSVGLEKYGGYEGVLSAVSKLRTKIDAEGRSLANSVRKAENKKAAEKAKEESFQALENIYRKEWDALLRLKQMAKTLHRLQVADVDTPTIVLCGAPNVGKSSLVREYSSGVPEVCAYPFTTKTIIMGHFDEKGKKYQMTDTPGLMNREEDARNTIERLAIAAIEHLRSVILFVVDLTEHCGTSVSDQLELRAALRERFQRPDQNWVDVLSKCDLTEDFKHEDLYLSVVPDPMRVSVESGQDLDKLKEHFLSTITKFEYSTPDSL